MGQAKKWLMEQDERGYRSVDGAVCSDCIAEAALSDWIKANLSSNECRFCGESSEDLIAASFDDFVGVVLAGVSFDWNNPDDEGIAHESAEGGYQANLTDSWDLLFGYGISKNSDLVEALIQSIDTDVWVESDFYVGDDSQRLCWGWESFKRFTKHQTRYLFLKSDGEDPDDLSPSRMLDAIASVISSDLEDISLVKTIKPEVKLFRIRIGEIAFNHAAEIGPPPEELATQSNRMSPAGISMFYGAFDIQTAKAETFDPKVHSGKIMSVGCFQALHELKVLDLADLPEVPSVFETSTRGLIHPLRFLHEFADDIAQPIARDGREHIEYVPTQIVTEYFRRVFRNANGQQIDGLIYKSSKDGCGKAIVLFCENKHCVDLGYSSNPNEKMLLLTSIAHQACSPAVD